MTFQQIVIHPDDRKMLRFLWFNDPFKEHPDIVQFQFCRLVFGLTPSPAILSSLIQHHLEKYEQKEPQVTALLKDSFYVDDFIGGSAGDDKAIEIYEKANEIMKDGGFGKEMDVQFESIQERVVTGGQPTKVAKPCHEPTKTAKALGSDRDMEVIDSPVKLSEESNCEFTPRSSKYNQDITEPVTGELPTSDSSNQDERSSVKVLGSSTVLVN